MGLDPISGFFAQRSANRQANKQYEDTQRQIAEYLGKYGNYQQGIQNMLNPGGQLSGMFGPQTSTQQGTSSSISNTNMLTRPEVAAENARLEGLLRTEMENKLGRGSALPPGYREMLARGVAESAQPGEQNIRNIAAQRGVSPESLLVGSPVEAQRAAGMADILPQVTMLERQLRGQDVSQAGQFAQSRLGQRQAGTQSMFGSTSGSSTGPANYGGILAALGMLAPHDPILVQKPTTKSPWLGAAEAAGQGGLLAAQLFGGGGMGGGAHPPGGSGGKF